MPISSSLCPSIAPFKNVTEQRSGNFRLATLPTSVLSCANAAAPESSANAAAPPTFFALKYQPSPLTRARLFASQLLINDPPCGLRVHANQGLPEKRIRHRNFFARQSLAPGSDSPSSERSSRYKDRNLRLNIAVRPPLMSTDRAYSVRGL